MSVLELLLLIAPVAIIVLLCFISWQIWQVSSKQPQMDLELTLDFSDQIQEIQNAAKHYADVSAVVSMVRQIDELDDDAVAQLKSYPKKVQAAAWIGLINNLGLDLQKAQKNLSDAHQRKGIYTSVYEIGAARRSCQKHVDDVRAKLDAAVAASGHYGLHTV